MIIISGILHTPSRTAFCAYISPKRQAQAGFSPQRDKLNPQRDSNMQPIFPKETSWPFLNSPKRQYEIPKETIPTLGHFLKETSSDVIFSPKRQYPGGPNPQRDKLRFLDSTCASCTPFPLEIPQRDRFSVWGIPQSDGIPQRDNR